MPILIKQIDGSVLSYFSTGNADLIGEVILIKSVVGEIGLEDYILLTAFEGFVQNFSSVVKAEFCSISPTSYGAIGCPTHNSLNISF